MYAYEVTRLILAERPGPCCAKDDLAHDCRKPALQDMLSSDTLLRWAFTSPCSDRGRDTTNSYKKCVVMDFFKYFVVLIGEVNGEKLLDSVFGVFHESFL